MKRFFISLALSSVAFMTYAQSYPVLSQYMQSLNAYNPAFAGNTEEICLSATNRQQWMGFPGRPITSFFTASAPLKPFGQRAGAGLSILNDQYGNGLVSDLAIAADLAVFFDAGPGKLGVGLNAGVTNRSFDPTNLTNPSEPEFFSTEDPLKPNAKDSRVAFNMNFGLSYTANNLYFGISSVRATQPEIKLGEAQPQYLVRHYALVAGYNFQLTNPLFEIMPSVFLSSDGVVNQASFTGMVRYNKKFWGGVSYRTGDALIGILGLEIFNGIKVGYSYDFTLTDIQNHSGGSHELWLGYCFSLSLEKSPRKYKSIRFL